MIAGWWLTGRQAEQSDGCGGEPSVAGGLYAGATHVVLQRARVSTGERVRHEWALGECVSRLLGSGGRGKDTVLPLSPEWRAAAFIPHPTDGTDARLSQRDLVLRCRDEPPEIRFRSLWREFNNIYWSGRASSITSLITTSRGFVFSGRPENFHAFSAALT